MTSPEEKELVRKIGETLVVMLRVKADMIKAGETFRQMECPRCGGELRIRLAGRRNHARMGCDGFCGMQAME